MNNDRYEALERVFHEPSRLAIVSALCAAEEGLPFTELRDACNLTDGNLNRHVKVLQEAGIVSVSKRFVDLKPRTTVCLTAQGLQRFGDYLEALKQVLTEAQASLPAQARPEGVLRVAAARP
jgi:DNA-binding transcriptional ArsR family regulator